MKKIPLVSRLIRKFKIVVYNFLIDVVHNQANHNNNNNNGIQIYCLDTIQLHNEQFSTIESN